MKMFTRIVGLLLCLAMVLSFVPVTHTHVQAASYQKIDLNGYTAKGASNNTDLGKDYEDRKWNEDISALIDGNVSAGFDIQMWPTYTADCYLDLTQKTEEPVVADQLKIYYVGYHDKSDDHGAYSVIPSLLIFLTLEDGSIVIKKFDGLDWKGVEDGLLEWSFDESYSIESIYIWSEETPADAYKRFSLAELELYRDTSRPEPVEYEKINLTGTVVGACSQSASGTDYASYSWFSDKEGKENWASWKTAVVDGDLSTFMDYSVGGTERADYYLDLSDNSDGYTAVDKLVMYHGGKTAVPKVDIVLVLEDGNFESESFTTSEWGTNANVSAITWVLDETCNVKGVYVNEPENTRASNGDIMLFQKVNTEPPVVEPEEPGELGTTTVGGNGWTQIELDSSNLIGACSSDWTPSLGYANQPWWFHNGTGSRGSYSRIEKLVDGSNSSYSEFGVSNGERADFYLDLSNNGNGTAVSAIKLYSYKYKDTSVPDKFEVVLMLKGGGTQSIEFETDWTKSTTNGTLHQEILDQTYTVTGMYVHSPDKTSSGHFSLGEFELWQKTQLPKPANLQATVDGDKITVGANKLAPASAGKLQFSIDNGTSWQDADGYYYTYTKTPGEYTIKARYLATGDGYITTKEANYASFTVTIAKQKLEEPTILNVDSTISSVTITATAPAGTLKYALVPDGEKLEEEDWQETGEFINLDFGTGYDYFVKCVPDDDDKYIESELVSGDVNTEAKRLEKPTNPRAVEVTENSITVTADANENGVLKFRIYIDGAWSDWTTESTFGNLKPYTTYEIHAIYTAKDTSRYKDSGFEIIRIQTKASSPEKIGFSYSIRLIEPWALRTNITFATADETLIEHDAVKNYGAYVITADKFDGSTREDLIADPDATAYDMDDFKDADDGTVYFDFCDGLYTYRMDKEICIVVYWEDAEGTKHYSDIQTISLAGVIQKIKEQGHAPDSELAVLNDMKSLHEALIAFRGQDAQLGNVYPEGVAVNAEDFSGKDIDTYKFGKTKQIRLIEPWGFRITVRYGTGSDNVGALSNASDYGMIFYYDTKGQFTDGMTADQIIAADGAQVFSNKNHNLEVSGNYFIAVFDDGIYTYQLNSNLYCLPFVEIDNQMYCQKKATVYNPHTMLTEEVGKSQAGNSSRDEKEIAVFKAMISLYENVNTHRNSSAK